VVRRCDDTVDKKRVNSCVLKYLFLERVEQPKKSQKKPGNALSDALLMSCFQNFAADAAKRKPRSARFFETALRAVLINELINQLIRINSGPNILRSCFLHCNVCVQSLVCFLSLYQKFLPSAHQLLLYKHIHMYESSAPSVRASSARGCGLGVDTERLTNIYINIFT